MKNPVAIALIIAGMILIITPAISDYLYQRNVVKLLEVRDLNRVTLAGKMGERYRFGCWAAGVMSICCAIGLSVAARKEKNKATQSEAG